MNQNNSNKLGFTLIEMMLALVTFLMLLSMVMIFVNSQRLYRRDVARLSNLSQLEKALEVYVSETGMYPVGNTCIYGQDDIIKVLKEKKVFDPGVVIGDPRWPDDKEFCYFYDGSASEYTLRFFLETDKAGKGQKGFNYIRS